MASAYTLTYPADLDPLLRHTVVSTGDVLTLRTGRGYRTIPLCVPLCGHCDGALDDEGYCASCQEPAHWRDTIRRALLPPAHLAPVRPCLVGDPQALTDTIHRIASKEARHGR